jgi:prevent-host-death family protein
MVELARSEGPQLVTRNGEPVAVIVSADEFKTMVRPRESVLEFFAPLRNSGIRLNRH